MQDPFEKSNRGKGWSRLLDFDSWIDSSIYNLFNSAADRWVSISIFFRRFRVRGWKRAVVELLDEGFTLGILGSIVMLALALPAFEETQKVWIGIAPEA